MQLKGPTAASRMYSDTGDDGPAWCCADLTLASLATMIAEFLTELDLLHVTLVCNDWGGAQRVASDRRLNSP